MPRGRKVAVNLADLVLTDQAGQPVRLSELPGVQVVVLMHHRH